MNLISIIIGSILFVITILMCLQESKIKAMPFWISFPLCFIISPFAVALIYSFMPMKNPIGCSHSGNTFNEAEYCGLCGKNELGNFHPCWKKNLD